MRGRDGEPSDTPVVAGVFMLAVFCLAELMVLFHLVFTVPKFREIYVQMDMTPPWPGRLFLVFCSVGLKFWFLTLPAGLFLNAAPLIVAERRAWIIYLAATVLTVALTLAAFLSLCQPFAGVYRENQRRPPPRARRIEKRRARRKEAPREVRSALSAR